MSRPQYFGLSAREALSERRVATSRLFHHRLLTPLVDPKTPLYFFACTTRFEQSISMELLDAGVVVAHLPDVTFRHVGIDQSAYAANDMRRPWD